MTDHQTISLWEMGKNRCRALGLKLGTRAGTLTVSREVNGEDHIILENGDIRMVWQWICGYSAAEVAAEEGDEVVM